MAIQLDTITVPINDLIIRNDFHIQNTIKPVKKFVIKDAIEISEKHGGLPIYACDKPSKTVGAKVFYTGSYDQFWTMYHSMSREDRCFYETILPEQPCHLYLDMEGDIEEGDIMENMKMNDYVELSQDLLNELIDFIIIFCKDILIHIKKEDFRIIELDSSSEKKFSKHYIIKIKDGSSNNENYIMFYNNFHCGALMRRFQKNIVQLYGGIDNNKYFHNHTSQRTENCIKTFLIDMGVYTLRRQFRLIGSAKRTQANKRREIWVTNKPKELTKELFLDCLIQYIPTNLSELKNNGMGSGVSASDQKVIHLLKITELNGSEAMSSSLKSFDNLGNPVSIAIHNQNIRHSIGEVPGSAISKWSIKEPNNIDELHNERGQKRKLNSNVDNYSCYDTMLPKGLQNALKKYYKDKWGYNICGYILSPNKIKLETYDKRCMNKKLKYKEDEHKFNHVYFVVFTNTLCHIQGCYDETYCIDVKTGKKAYTNLGKIDDDTIIKEIILWQKNQLQNNLEEYAESWTDDIFIKTI